MSHAYLITGPNGAEKRARVVEMAQQYLCTGSVAPCGTCEHCRKVAQGIHPDFITIGAGDKPISVGDVRNLGSDAYILPNQARRKVYLLPDADLMQIPAQNAMLKLLEDGPAYAAFLLLAQREGAMLITVRSRCEVVRMDGCQGDLPDPELVEQGETLARLLLAGDELALLEHCVALEKWERARLSTLFELTIQALHHDMGQGQVKLRLDRIVRLSALRQSLEFNAGAGHVLGSLCAQSF